MVLVWLKYGKEVFQCGLPSVRKHLQEAPSCFEKQTNQDQMRSSRDMIRIFQSSFLLFSEVNSVNRLQFRLDPG